MTNKNKQNSAGLGAGPLRGGPGGAGNPARRAGNPGPEGRKRGYPVFLHFSSFVMLFLPLFSLFKVSGHVEVGSSSKGARF